MAVMSSILKRQWGVCFLVSACVLLMSAAAAFSRPEEGYIPPATSPWQAETLDIEALTRKSETLHKEVDALAALINENDRDSGQFSSLKTQIALLDQLVEIVRSRTAIETEIDRLSQRKESLETEIRAFESQPPPEPPENPTRDGYETIANRLKATTDELSELRAEARERSNRIETLASERQTYRDMVESASRSVLALSEKVQETADAARRRERQLQLDNARIQKRIGEEGLAYLDLMESHEKAMAPFRNQRIDYLQRRLFRQENTYAAYLKALEATLASEQAETLREMAEKKTEAEQAEAESDRFLAAYEARIASVTANLSRLESKATRITDIEKRLQERLDEEKARFEALKTLVLKAGRSGETGRRLRMFFQRIQNNRTRFHFFQLKEVTADIESYRNRRFEIEELLLELEDNWRDKVTAASAALPEGEKAEFGSRALTLRENLRTALLEELDLLNKVILAEENVQDMAYSFSDLMDDMEQFLLPRLFWIRDGQPLGPETWDSLKKDLATLSEWRRETTDQIRRRSLEVLVPRAALVFGLLLIVGPMAAAFISRRWLAEHRIGSSPDGKIKGTLGLVGIAVLVPVYFYLTSLLLKAIPFPGDLHMIAAAACMELSLIALIWCVAKTFFEDEAISTRLFNMAPDTAAAIGKFLKTLAVLKLVLTLIPAVLKQPPFVAESFMGIANTIFAAAILVPLYRLIRPASPLGRAMKSVLGGGFLGRNWGLLVVLVTAVLAGAALMGAMGYRYGASRIFSRTFWTLFIGMAGIGVHQWLIDIVRQRAVCIKAEECTETSSEEEASEVREFRMRCNQIQRFITLSCAVVAAFLIAVEWGVNRQVIQSLDDVTLYTMATETGVVPVTLANLAFAFTTLVIMTVLLKNLPGIYEVVLFQRMRFDSGLQYALLNITRYGIFFLGVLIALSYIHLDLGRITWLMAAVGFGLGFGMQEIFSNFVSGLILLVERPVRVGDIVKVGDVLGTVSHINIRATTVTDFDRLEVVIPNKDFITREVTNWTLGDRIIRLIVPIGVAYGTDPEAVDNILLDIAREDPEVLDDPSPNVLFLEHGDSSLNFELRCYLGDPDNLLAVKSRLNHRINHALAEHGIEIPFPQRDIHIRSMPPKGETVGQE